MFRYFLKRLLFLVPVMMVIVTIVFFLLRCVPGDPVDFILGESAQGAERSALIAQAGFDLPLWQQYTRYVNGVMHGDLGNSYFKNSSVLFLIGERYPATLLLAVTSLLFCMIVSLPAGLYAASRGGKVQDRALLLVSLTGISIPSFYLGPLLVLLFAIKIPLLPVAGKSEWSSFILPSITLGGAMSAYLFRMTRSTVLDALRHDYVRTARAKGISEKVILVKHAFRNALLPLLPVVGLQFGTLLAGAVVTEKIFSWPGIGSLLLESIQKRDYAVVQGIVLILAFSYVTINLITDLLCHLADPRFEVEEGI